MQKKQPEAVFLYFIEGMSTKHVKIGVSHQPWKRLKQLQSGSPDTLRLRGVVKFDTYSEAFEEEKCYHSMMDAKGLRLRQEWFETSQDLENHMLYDLERYHGDK